MQLILVWTILAISGVFMTLTVLIIANKAWRETQTAWFARRRRELEPKVLNWAHGDEKTICSALDGRPSSFDLTVLEGILLDHLQRVRGIEHKRLAQAMEQLGLVDTYLETLESRRWWRRAGAAEKLGLSENTRSIQALSLALDDETSEVRLRAATALGQLGGSASVRKLVRALDEPNHWSTIRVADILIRMGHKAIDDLIEAFPELSLQAQLAVLDIVGRVRPVAAAPWLIKQLASETPDVRARAAHALGSIGDPNLASHLLAALEDPEWPVRAMAAKALGQMRVAQAIRQLSHALRDSQWWVRHNAALALRAIGPRGLNELEVLVADGDAFAREQAILMLEEAGRIDERVAELSGPATREAARKFMKRIVAAGSTGRLRVLSCEHPEAEVRRELLALLPEKAAS